MEDKKVSIILPVYNNREDIEGAIQSIFDQDYTNWELIIVDDCSSDGTYEFLRGFIESLPFEKKARIVLCRNEKNLGCYCSINEGLLRSTGDFITRLDSDDKYPKDKLSKQVTILNNRDNLIATCGISLRGNTRIRDNEITLMFRKEVLQKLGFFDSVRFGADSEFKHRLETYYGSNKILRTKDVIYYAKSRPNSLTRSETTGIFTSGRPIRKQYVQNYIRWHKDVRNDKTELYVPYPLDPAQRVIKVPEIMLP